MSIRDFSELKSFLSGYFHQDWELDANNPDDIIIQFIKTNPPENIVRTIATQIDLYLEKETDDPTTESKLLNELGCYYLPRADGISVRNWLTQVKNRLLSK